MKKMPLPFRPIVALVGILAIVLGYAPGHLSAQEMEIERSRVLPKVGEAESRDIDLFPVLDEAGRVFEQIVRGPEGATYLRLRFAIERTGDGWGVQTRDANGNVVWSTWSEQVDGTSFWSDEIPGNRVTVEIYSSRPDNPLELSIDSVMAGQQAFAPESLTGPDQREPILGQDDWIVGQGRSVAKLKFVGNDGNAYVCTAFLLTPDLMLTNEHCIATESEMRSALVEFDFDRSGEPPAETSRLRELSWTDKELDFAVVRLERPTTRPPLPLAPGRSADNSPLLIIQHPGGEPKQVSIDDCRVDGTAVPGRFGTATDFGHLCDTLGGSSGSPVIDFGSRRVVGLHHLGFAPGSDEPFNRAVHLDLILDRMDSELRNEIEGR